MNDGFKLMKEHYLQIAKELLYSDRAIEEIKASKNEIEIQRILTTARKGGNSTTLNRPVAGILIIDLYFCV